MSVKNLGGVLDHGALGQCLLKKDNFAALCLVTAQTLADGVLNRP